MKLNHSAIFALYPNVVTVDDATGVFDKDGNKVEIDIDSVNAWVDPNKYKYERSSAYPSITDQLDMLYHDKINNTNTWQTAIEAVKTKYPKA
jgi:hypothetical protein